MTRDEVGSPRPVHADELPEGRRAVLAMYQRVRRYAVPMWMIEAAAERRLAGDVAGACAAAGIDLDVDRAAVARACGRETADLIADDLRHLAPDLLRWHMPRVLDDPPGPIWHASGVLRRYPAGGGAVLLVDKAWKDPVRLKLRVVIPRAGNEAVHDRGSHMYHLHRSCWDTRHTDELRERCGGTDRIPFFHADGRPLDVDELPGGPSPDDPVADVEWLTMLWDHGRVGEALAECGITLEPGEPNIWEVRPQVAVERLVADARNVLDHGVPEPPLVSPPRRSKPTVWLDGGDETQVFPDVELTFGRAGRVTARRRNHPIGESLIVTIPEYRHPIDFDLLRFGYLQPGDLHPLVARALFPARDPAGSGPPPPPRSAAGTDTERQEELLDRAYHGDTPGVVALLDAGFDPMTRNDAGETLLHLLAHLDHEVLLPRLLAAGLHINTPDAEGRTPLHAAAEWLSARRHADDLIDRLIDAGGTDTCRQRGAMGCLGSEVVRTPPPPEDAVWQQRPAPAAAELRRLRKAAKRGRYRSRVRLARGLYLTGLGPREVLTECFGVTFPDEFLQLAEHGPLPGHRPENFDHHAWKLAVPPDQGGPVWPRSGPFADLDDNVDDERILKRDRDLIPLLDLDDHYTEHGGLTLCYRVTELAAGRSAVFGIDALDPGEEVERCGASLLAVLRDHHATVVDRLETLERHAPDPVTQQRLTDHRAALDKVEALIRTTADLAPATVSPTTAPLATLRARASRGDYRSMSRLARALYATGLGPREVLAECFGVAFPDEFFVIVDADPHDATPGEVANLPWKLAVPLDRGGPMVRPLPMMWPAERRIFSWDPDLVPLVALYGDGRVDHGAKKPQPQVPHGDRIHCYRLSELAVGRSTVVAVPWHRADEGGELFVEPSGQSLLTVLHEYLTAQHRLNGWEIVQPWNRGAGSIDDTEVEETRERVAEIEALQRRLGDRMRPAEK
ncbi:ankyrin repeat domain-containing protein [Streptosporangium sp. NPDC000396]|uniref:ankyrin repeat domain-containing protein n=1 Tax=Streptosporangium sp. NPDC000396 TaxID=3366185 RepID=UPI003681760A